MNFHIFSSLTIYALVTGWSPGPNNILLLSTTGQFGLKRSIKLITGIWSGLLYTAEKTRYAMIQEKESD